ncbi:DNA polymerase I [uncultured Mediterranean phage uvMED]|nr:DNA polymerase I [uncultured Mediterranean phage uvMED]BAR21938.1 DNA polymerase [uncultured Mediterranean phage uvMED]
MTSTITKQEYSVYYGIKELKRLQTAHSLAFDTETLQLQPEEGKLRLIQLGCYSSRTIVVIDCFELERSDWNYLEEFFSSTNRFWLAHNAVFDIAWLQEQGIHINGFVRCSMIASRLLTNGIPQTKHGLDALAKRQLNIEVSKEQQKSNWGLETLSKEQLTYAAKDIEILLELDNVLDQKIRLGRLEKAYALECRALPAMAQMWRIGLPWNREELEQCRTDYEDDIKELGNEFIRELDNDLPVGKKLPRNEDGTVNLRAKDQGSVRLGTKQYAGFNIKSSKQLLEKLELVLGYTPVNKDGKPSVAKDALKSCAADSPTIQTLMTWKRREKRRQMIESILDKMSDDGYVRASYMQLGADTGRMSSIKPNNQQIPRDSEFRQCVQAPEGWKIVDADFSQMELRLAAALANDKNMIAAFKRGDDLHDYTAQQMGCDRQIAKSANFGLLYGAGAEGLRNYAGSSGVIMSSDEAAKVRDNWLNTYSGIKSWQQEMNYLVRSTEGDEWPETRIPVSNMRRFLKGDLNRVTVRCNTPIQGAGAAILKCALGNLWTQVKEAGEDKVRIAAAVHDELLLLVKEDIADEWAQILKTTMEKAEAKWLGEIPALAEVSIGDKWSEVH